MSDQELESFAAANKAEFLRLQSVDRRWLLLYLIGVATGMLVSWTLIKGLL